MSITDSKGMTIFSFLRHSALISIVGLLLYIPTSNVRRSFLPKIPSAFVVFLALEGRHAYWSKIQFDLHFPKKLS